MHILLFSLTAKSAHRKVQIILLMTCKFHEPFLQVKFCNCAITKKILLDILLYIHIINFFFMREKRDNFLTFFYKHPSRNKI